MDFLTAIDSINNNNYNYGNDILYSSFNFSKGIFPSSATTLDTKLSSAMSIIGKSYSADPTRSAPSGTFSNDGVGFAFDALAAQIVQHKSYSDFYTKIYELSSKVYVYTNAEEDKQTLLDTIECVKLLNILIKDSINTIAKNNGIEDKESHNTVSFCSKLLHFICPSVFFIIDSYSLDGGIGLYNGKKTRKIAIENSSPTIWIDIDTTAFTLEFKPELECDDEIKTYTNHCFRAYSLSAVFYKEKINITEQIKGDNSSKYITRLVDSVLMRIKKEK